MAVALVKDNDIEAAAAMDNVDRAAKHLQDLAGIATGDVWSIRKAPSAHSPREMQVNRPRAAMSRRPETAEGARIKFWIARAMPEDCLQISFPTQSPGIP